MICYLKLKVCSQLNMTCLLCCWQVLRILPRKLSALRVTIGFARYSTCSMAEKLARIWARLILTLLISRLSLSGVGPFFASSLTASGSTFFNFFSPYVMKCDISIDIFLYATDTILYNTECITKHDMKPVKLRFIRHKITKNRSWIMKE